MSPPSPSPRVRPAGRPGRGRRHRGRAADRPDLRRASWPRPPSTSSAAIPRDAAGEPVGNPLDFRYEWDFGDPAGRYNTLPGWNAAHVYDRPGQYTITLTVRGQDGKETRRTTWVRVAPDDRKRVYVSADGNDAADGAAPARPVRSVERAFHLAKDDAWVLFRKGDMFDVSAPVTLYSRGLRVGNYSRTGGRVGRRRGGPGRGRRLVPGVPLALPPGARPPAGPPPADEPLPVLRKVQAPPKADAIFMIQPKAADTLVEGIEFDSIWDLKSEFGVKKVPARGVHRRRDQLRRPLVLVPQPDRRDQHRGQADRRDRAGQPVQQRDPRVRRVRQRDRPRVRRQRDGATAARST